MTYSASQGFLEKTKLVLLKGSSTFNNSYLSINIPIQQIQETFTYIKAEREKFRKFEPEILQLYKDESLHFTLAAAIRLTNDPDVEKIKKIVEPQKEEIIKIVEEETAKLRTFKIAAKFTKATDKSIFVFVSFEKEMERDIETFQNNIVNRVYKILEDTGVKRYTGNKPFGRPVNFARWDVAKLPKDAKVFFEQYTKGFTEEIRAEGEVAEAVLTYSDQSWSNPKENTIKKFELK